MTCDYAHCRNRALTQADGWAFCGGHLAAHRAQMREDRGEPEPSEAERLLQVRQMHSDGMTDSQIGEALGVHRKTVAVYRARAGLPVNRAVIPCGTRSGYLLHHRNNEAPCDPCAEANRTYQRENHHRRRRALSL